jgi:dipeptidyl aminopeptidase/acylaminoacyl peptidase
MLAFTRPSDGLEGIDDHMQYSSEIQAAVNFSGAVDLADWNREPYVGAYMGGSSDSKPALLRRASPVEYIKEGTPPVLTIHGDNDISVPVKQAYALAEKMKEAGASHTLVIKPGYGHAFDFDEAIWKFLDRVLKM